MKKIKAFTIIELIVSMLISSIVIAMAYNAFLFFNEQFRQHQLRSTATEEYFLAGKAIKTDFERSAAITDSLTDFIILQQADTNSPVIYEIGSSAIIRRTGESTDSFHVKNRGVKTFYVNDSVQLIREIAINFIVGNTLLEKRFTKHYSASELISAKTIDHE